MPKSRRDKEISLTKIKKKTKEDKENIISKVTTSLGEHKHLFVYSIGSLNTTKMTQIRQHFKKNSKFFNGKNTLMGVALGRDATTEKANGLHKVSKLLKGKRGLMFTNESQENVVKFFNDLSESDYEFKLDGHWSKDEGLTMLD